MLDLTDGAKKLRSGLTLWEKQNPPVGEFPPDLPSELSADIVIVGAGITGAFLAERLSRDGRRIVVLDRRGPQRGSTAASTSLVQWEIDAPMIELEQRLGFAAAARIYRRTRDAVSGIAGVVAALGLPCDFHPRHSLYLAGTALDPSALREEHRLREMAGIRGALLGEEDVAGQGFAAGAALRYGGSAEADPVALARGLLDAAIRRGVLVATPVTAITYDTSSDGVWIATDRDTTIRAGALVLATGYEIPAVVPSEMHRIVSTWALATEPLPADRLWRSGDLVWEASDPYLYMRTTGDGRIIAGGEDESITDPVARDALIGSKTARLVEKLGALRRGIGIGEPELSWTGFFGETEDGLPLIGRVPGMDNCYAAYGYGGNGIAFSALAAGMIAGLIAGDRDPDEELLAIDRSA